MVFFNFIFAMNHCYLLTALNNGDLITFNTDTTSKVINIQPYPYNDVLLYRQINHSHYQWCGPLILTAEYFARFSKRRWSPRWIYIFNCLISESDCYHSVALMILGTMWCPALRQCQTSVSSSWWHPYITTHLWKLI